MCGVVNLVWLFGFLHVVIPTYPALDTVSSWLLVVATCRCVENLYDVLQLEYLYTWVGGNGVCVYSWPSREVLGMWERLSWLILPHLLFGPGL